MATIVENIQTLQSIKSDIKSAILEKGGSVTDAFGGYAQAIKDLPSGGDTSIEDALVQGTLSGVYSNPRVTNVKSYLMMGNSYITSIDMDNVRLVGDYAFSNCSQLKSVNLPKCETLNTGVFMNDYSLYDVNIPMCRRIDPQAFYNCRSLSTLELPICSSIMDSAFKGAGLQHISLPLCEYIGYMALTDCYYLTSLELPVCSYINRNAITNTSALSYVYLGSASMVSFYDITITFTNANSNLRISVPESLFNDYIDNYGIKSTQLSGGVRKYFYDIFMGGTVQWKNAYIQYTNGTESTINYLGTTLDKIITTSSAVIIRDLSSGVTSLMSYAFGSTNANYAMRSLQEVDLPALTSIATGAFYYCTSLSSIDLTNVVSIEGNAFHYCSALTEVNAPLITTANYSVFADCTNISRISVPKVSIFYSACFNQLKSLTSVSFGAVDSVELQQYAFGGCTNLTEVDATACGWMRIVTPLAFNNCNSQLSIKVPASLYDKYTQSYGGMNVNLSGVTRLVASLFVAV